jgi:glutamine amidotransferase
MSIAIVDYGAGNLTSVKKALDCLGQTAYISSDPERVSHAEKLIVPGVGHFAATAAIDRYGLREVIEKAIARGIPFLGICLGMQWMFASSAEAPDLRGLGLFPGTCTLFPADVKIPHVGWNELMIVTASPLLRGIPSHSFVYFTHSYKLPVIDETVATSEYGEAFSAIVERERAFGVQFHPEKSGAAGKKILENFCELPC